MIILYILCMILPAIAGVGMILLLPYAWADNITCAVRYGTCYGTAGDDIMTWLNGTNQMSGQGGNDQMTGGPGNDSIQAFEGNDRIVGKEGDDEIVGGGRK
jgi:Ca2+-binding RTX toxin-like protein